MRCKDHPSGFVRTARTVLSAYAQFRTDSLAAAKMTRLAPALLLILVASHVSAAQSLPIWTDTFVAPKDGHSYTIQEVGGNPFFNGSRAIPVQVNVVPLVFTFSDGTVDDARFTVGIE